MNEQTEIKKPKFSKPSRRKNTKNAKVYYKSPAEKSGESAEAKVEPAEAVAPAITPTDTSKLSRFLTELGYSESAISRIESAKDRLEIPDDDAALTLLLELEAYLKLYEEIPEKIKAAHETAIKQAEMESQKTLNQMLNKMSDQWIKKSEYMLDKHIKLKRVSTLLWSAVMLFVVSATSMSLYALFEGQLPIYLSNGFSTGLMPLDWVLGALNAPSWLVILGALGVIGVIKGYQLGMYATQERDD